MAQLIREWVSSCEQCLGESRSNSRLTRTPLQNPNEYLTAPEDAMQIDLVPGLPPSGGFENIVTALDVFSRCLFAYPTSNQDAKTNVQNLINIITQHAYLPTTLISYKGTAFMSIVIEEMAGVLSITLKHATTKHAQTIGLHERSHASTNRHWRPRQASGENCGINKSALRSLNTTHLIGCEPSRVFHGRIPYNNLDLRIGIRPKKFPSRDSQIVQDVLEHTEMIFQVVRRIATQAFIKDNA